MFGLGRLPVSMIKPSRLGDGVANVLIRSMDIGRSPARKCFEKKLPRAVEKPLSPSTRCNRTTGRPSGKPRSAAMIPTITAFERSPDGGAGLSRDTRVRWALEEVGQP